MSITRINNNIAALNASRNVFETGNKLQKSIERLSSGLRVNSAGDDAAGLTVAARLRSQVNGLNQATANAQDGINLISVAEGALEETSVRLNRIRTLAIQAANTGVNDVVARRALQDEVFQSIDEVSRIASTTQFGGNFLLRGDFAVNTEIKDGQQDFGINVDPSPSASTLSDGLAFLSVRQLEKGESRIVGGDAAGGQQILATGIVDAQDIAVSSGIFTAEASIGSTAAAGADLLSAGAFNNVSVAGGLILAFEGVLADGITRFTGTVSTGQSLSALASVINAAISAAEITLFGDSIDTGFDISAYASNGRIVLAAADGAQNFNQASISLRLVDSGNTVTEAIGVSRVNIDPGDVIGFANNDSGLIGNSTTAITGSTFGTGDFTISIEDVQSAQQRTVKSTVAFTDLNGNIIDRTSDLVSLAAVNGRFEGGVFTGYASINTGDTITLIGTNQDGSTFSRTFSLTTVEGDAYDSEVASISGLIRELNNRLYSNGVQGTFNGAVATFASDGTIKVIDEQARNGSELTFTLVFNLASTNGLPSGQSSTTISDNATLQQEGFQEQATVRINGGESVRVNAGEIVTLYGEETSVEGVPTPQATFRLGRGLTAGTDTLVTKASTYVGQLNGGVGITFQNGDQDVTFVSNTAGQSGVAQILTVDFDNIIDVTKASGTNDTGTTVILETTNEQLNFQVGAFADQNFRVSLGDLRADSLGFGEGSGRTVADIDITTLDGANEALAIIDEALDQVNRTRSLLGAATNRLDSTVANLSVTAENLTASESRIMDADIASETTEFTLRQVQLQAGISVLAQANFQTQSLLALLG